MNAWDLMKTQKSPWRTAPSLPEAYERYSSSRFDLDDRNYLVPLKETQPTRETFKQEKRTSAGFLKEPSMKSAYEEGITKRKNQNQIQTGSKAKKALLFFLFSLIILASLLALATHFNYLNFSFGF